jgi:hypothetical protein
MASNIRPRIDVAALPVEDMGALERSLPPSLSHIAAAIVASRSMLELDDDWDGEGSPGYSAATWRRAVGLLLTSALVLAEDRELTVPRPNIRKGPLGSIDLHWQTAARELLVNVPAKADEPADYYGDDRAGGHVVKGTLDPDEEND